MEQLNQLKAAYNTEVAAANALLASANLTEDARAQAQAHVDRAKELKAQIESAESAASLRNDAAGLTAMVFGTPESAPAQTVASTLAPSQTTILPGMTETKSDFSLPAMAARSLPKFIRDTDGRPDPKLAFKAGKWLQATLGRNLQAQKWCFDHGVPMNVIGTGDTLVPIRQFAQSEGVNTAGGVLVFDEFERVIIDLKEKYGVFRQWADLTPMSSDTKLVPRRTGGVTSYFIGEGATITDSSAAWDNVSLVAKKLATLVYVSNELNEDAIISMADKIANEIAWNFALTEDNCGFNGDGTNSTATFSGATVYYGGITGVRSKLSGLSGTIGNIAGIVVGTGSASYSALTMSDFHKVVGRLPEYAAQQSDVAWYVSRPFYFEVMQRLMLAQGGSPAYEAGSGGPNMVFLGYPVRISQVLPSVAAASQVCALLGSLRLSTMFGDRRMTTLAVSEHTAFTSDQLAIRATQRFDINVHSVGNADSTAANRIPGPIVALATGA